jgi:putative methyltransferase (TIGR04325 family)
MKDLLPPLLLRTLGAASRRQHLSFVDGFASWQQAKAASTGYEAPSILEKVAQASLKVKRGEAAYERDSVIFDTVQHNWPVLAGLMWVAAKRGSLNVLDVGGALGTSYFENRRFLETLAVRWNIVEQSHFVDRGRRDFEDGRLRFFGSVREAANEAAPHAALMGCVLQYLEAPYECLGQVAALAPDLIILDRLPLCEEPEDCLCVQRVPAEIYDASYPCWLFSRAKLDAWMTRNGWRLMDTYETAEGSMRTVSGRPLRFTGLLLAR